MNLDVNWIGDYRSSFRIFDKFYYSLVVIMPKMTREFKQKLFQSQFPIPFSNLRFFLFLKF